MRDLSTSNHPGHKITNSNPKEDDLYRNMDRSCTKLETENGKNEIQRAVELLRASSCVDIFNSVDQETYQLRLSKLLTELVIQSKDDKNIEASLYGAFKWSALIKQHDQVHQKRKFVTYSFESPLQEVCAVLVNPRALPIACSCHTFMCLLRVFIEHPTKLDRTADFEVHCPSESTIIHALGTLARRILPSSLLTDMLKSYFSEMLRDKQKDDELLLKSVVRLNRLLSVTAKIAREQRQLWLGVACLSSMLIFVEEIDAVDISRLVAVRKNDINCHNSDGQMCLGCQKTIAPLTLSVTPRRRRVGLAQMLDEAPVHDNDEHSATTKSETPRYAPAGAQCTCSYTSRKPFAKASSFTQIPFDFVLLRSRIYQQLLSTFSFLQVSIPHMKRNKFKLTQLSVAVLEQCLDNISHSPSSPAHRLVLLLLSDELGPRGRSHLIQRLWQRWDDAIVRNGNGAVYLQTLAELLVESHYFDETRRCWKGIEQLVTRLAIARKEKRSGVSKPDHALLLQAFSYIISRRRLDDPQFLENRDFKNVLRWQQKAIQDHPDLVDREHQNITDFDDAGAIGVKQKVHYPFPINCGIRAAHKRMGPSVVYHQLLSDNHQQLSKPLASKEEPQKKVQKVQKVPMPPFLEFINDDVLRHIQSFMGYAELVRVTFVCKTWNNLTRSEIQWKQIYRDKYGLLGEDDDIQKAVSKIGSWKNLFVERYCSEKALKFQYSKSGWKYQICAHVGCGRIMRSAEQQETHLQTHKKQVLQRIAKKAAAKEREALRAEKKRKRKEDAAARKKRKSESNAEAKSRLSKSSTKESTST